MKYVPLSIKMYILNLFIQPLINALRNDLRGRAQILASKYYTKRANSRKLYAKGMKNTSKMSDEVTSRQRYS